MSITTTNPAISGRQARAIRLWLYAVAAMVLAIVLVGGATRLTESGLSITEWKPVMGVVPPLSGAQWQSEFEKYQAIPQYRELNNGMSLDAFKTIYWWEWTHRLIARTIGVVFLLPFLWFWWRGSISPGLRNRLWLIFGLGALQGAVGWWMVASGLADRIEVSQYRLATHLVLACLIYVALLWTAQRWDKPPTSCRAGAHSLRRRCAAHSGAGANLSRRHRCRTARRAHLQYLAADRRRADAGPGAAVLQYAAVAEFLREHAHRAVRSPHAGLCDLDRRAAARLRSGARDEERTGGRRRAAARGRGDAASRARHLDAVDGRAARSGAAAPGDGDDRADRCDGACGVRRRTGAGHFLSSTRTGDPVVGDATGAAS